MQLNKAVGSHGGSSSCRRRRRVLYGKHTHTVPFVFALIRSTLMPFHKTKCQRMNGEQADITYAFPSIPLFYIFNRKCPF